MSAPGAGGTGGPRFDPTAAAARYSGGDVVARVDSALAEAGFGDGPIPPEVLGPLDQFHVGGAAATSALAGMLGIAAGSSVLDVGCGLGGPSRHLAAAFGCTVEGIDLSRPFIELATNLTRRTGLSHRVGHRVADACSLPFPPGSFDLAWTQHVARNIADGHALYSGVHRVLRPGGRFAMPDGEPGELWIRGANVSPGYWRDPEATARAFRDGYWMSGDVGSRDPEGGLYYVHDRIKDMVNRGGYKVFSAEVENALMGHPEVADCAVVGVPDPVLGERVFALVSTRADSRADGAGLRAWLLERIADYKVPERWQVGAEPVPRNQNGKQQKAEVRRLALRLPEGAPA